MLWSYHKNLPLGQETILNGNKKQDTRLWKIVPLICIILYQQRKKIHSVLKEKMWSRHKIITQWVAPWMKNLQQNK